MSARGPCPPPAPRRRARPARPPSSMASARSGSHHDVGRRRARPATTSSMMASGSSWRGLSDVTTATSARSRGDGAHERAAWRGPGPRRTRTRTGPGGPPARRRALSSATGQPVGGVGVVDHHGERGRGVDHLEPPGHGRGPVQARPRRRPRAPRAPRRSWPRPGRWPRGTTPVSASSTRRPRHVNDVRRRAALDVGDLARSSTPPPGWPTRSRRRRPQASSALTTASAARSGVNSDALAAKYASMVPW